MKFSFSCLTCHRCSRGGFVQFLILRATSFRASRLCVKDTNPWSDKRLSVERTVREYESEREDEPGEHPGTSLHTLPDIRPSVRCICGKHLRGTGDPRSAKHNQSCYDGPHQTYAEPDALRVEYGKFDTRCSNELDVLQSIPQPLEPEIGANTRRMVPGAAFMLRGNEVIWMLSLDRLGPYGRGGQFYSSP